MPNVTVVDRLDGVNEGVAAKAPCRVATTANITLSGLQTIDGVSVVAGDRVLVKDQATAADRGIYVVSADDWTRAVDCDAARDLVQGTRIFVYAGSTNAMSEWIVTTDDPITVGTTSLAFVEFCCCE